MADLDFDAARELAFALHLCDLADAITLPRYLSRSFNLDWKANRTEVTEADRDAESAISTAVLSERPRHGLLGEEHGIGVRLAYGIASLPLNSPVEVELLLEVD